MQVGLAIGRNFTDCSPVKGSYKGTSDHVLHVGVAVSYEDGSRHDDTSAVLAPQPKNEDSDPGSNSYRRYMEMMQQQQQQ